MFDIGWSELLLIGVVALIAIGPKELPGALRTLGQWMAKIRRMAAEFQGQFQEAMREAEIDQLKKDMDDMAAKATDYTQFDPMADVQRDIEKSMGDLPPLDQPATTTSTAETTEASATATAPEPSGEAGTSAALPAPAEQSAAATPEPATAATSSAPEPEPAVAGGKADAGRAPA
jgi:sec-independent protein translocase protein TatB